MMRRPLQAQGILFASLALLLGACATPSAPPRSTAGGTEQRDLTEARRGGTITIPVTSQMPVIGIVGVASTTTGGWGAVSEVHSNGLITSDMYTRKPVGRLAERVPSLDDGTISVLPDGRMRVVYHLRKGVTWQDGAPFTAQDLVFSYHFNSDPGIPALRDPVIRLMESVEAADDHTP